MTENGFATRVTRGSSRYTLLEKLGAGGQAEVWRARDESAGVEVALKVLNPTLARDEGSWAALTREHAIASRMDHPAILKVNPPYREGDFVALPMELASGGDLRRLRGKGYLDIVPVLIDIAQGLEYAHEHGVIHRDLKPGNVLFDSRGRVRIADFGIAGAPGEVNPAVVRHGLSPFTASPEQLRGDPPAISDDIYGLGALAYELLSGYPPYYPRFEVKRALEEPVPELKPAQIMPHQLANTIMRMLAKRASLRHRSMREVIDDFDAALNDTLTFDFDRAEEPASGASASMRRDAAVLAAAEAAKRASSLALDEPDEDVRVTGARAKRTPAIPADAAALAAEKLSADIAARARPRPERAAPNVERGSSSDAEHLSADIEPTTSYSEPMTASGDDQSPELSAGIPRDEYGWRKQSPRAAEITATFETHVGGEDELVPDIEPMRTGDPTQVEGERIAAAAAAVREAAPHLVTAHAPPTYWDDVRLSVDPSPQYHRSQRPRRRSWPWVVLTALVVAAVLVFVVLPRYGDALEDLTKPTAEAATPAMGASAPTSADARPSASNWPAPGGAASAPGDRSTGASGASGKNPASNTGTDRATRAADHPGSGTRANSAPLSASAGSAVLSAPPPEPAKPVEEKPATITPEAYEQLRSTFDQRLAALESKGAGSWGGPDFAAAKTRAAESVGANDAGSPEIAEKRLNDALRLLGLVEARANPTLASQLTTGETALAEGQGEVAKQAFESARRIDPNSRRAQDGLQRVRNLGGLLPLLADGENAEGAKDYARAVQDYSQALSLDPNNAKAKAGLARAHAAFGEDTYAKSVGSGFAALGAGRLDDARIAFEKARTIRPNGPEAATGLSRVGAALRARGFASTRQKAAGLEAEERWPEAAAEYDAALKVDPSLVFAQQGKARALARSELSDSLQALIDRPDRLASSAVRTEADTLIKRAAGQDPSGPVLRSQIQRLQILLPGFDVPVRIEMLSDNATQVQIQRVGTFGSFNKREIELKPGKYTVVGTRPGFRDVRRDVTIAPGGDVQTISVSCVEPI
jgi:serine/threonine protein kinase/tetratricopeptide (TPR) repeat protein